MTDRTPPNTGTLYGPGTINGHEAYQADPSTPSDEHPLADAGREGEPRRTEHPPECRSC